MPLTKQAIKKMRRDQKVTKRNEEKKKALKQAIKSFKKSPRKSFLDNIYSLIDRSVKTHLIHKNKASRLKSRLSKLVTK